MEALDLEYTVARTRAFAVKHHGTQTDKNKRPYVHHLDAVANNCRRLYGFEADTLKVAYLHDVVEDTRVTVKQVETLFGEDIALAVDAISKRSGEKNYDYIGFVLGDETASKVKLADLYHNTMPERLAELDQYTQRRLKKKYFPAIYRLETALGIVPTITRDQAVEAVRGTDTGGAWTSMTVGSLRPGDRIRFTNTSDVHLIAKKVLFSAAGKKKARIETTRGTHFTLLSSTKVQCKMGGVLVSDTEIAKYLGEHVSGHQVVTTAGSGAKKPTVASLVAAGVKP